MLRRQRRQLKALEKYLIVCEGKVTEPIYFEAIRREKRLSTDLIRVEPAAGVPLSVVKRAIFLKRNNDVNCGVDDLDKYKQVWVVFDHDDHPKLQEALTLAHAEKIEVAFSNPCFEVFLLVHFTTCTKNEHRTKISQRLRKFVPDYQKDFDYQKLELERRYPKAKANCGQMNAKSIRAGLIQQPPYCSVPRLVDILKALPSSPFR